MTVRNDYMVVHTQATADASHTFKLIEGTLWVDIPNNAGGDTEYQLTNGVLTVNPGFTGTITAEYEFTPSPTREIDFEYDHNGLRTQKRIVENGVTTTYDYTLHGKLITHMTKTTGSAVTDTLHFFYDANSRPAMVNHNGAMYRYVHNLQGDIVGILDTAGNLVVEYKYDAWGRLLSITGGLAGTLGKCNPFLYRGYIYDVESDLHYLCSRYYNSKVGRFANVDGYVATSEDLTACDMFTYCFNSPIMGFDPVGTDCICLHQRVHGNHICYSTVDSPDASVAPYTVLYSEHKKNARPSTENKHQEGQSRKQRDARGERGDARREDRSNKKKKGNRKSKFDAFGDSLLLLGAMIYVVVNDASGVGTLDDAALAPLGDMLWDNVTLLFA